MARFLGAAQVVSDVVFEIFEFFFDGFGGVFFDAVGRNNLDQCGQCADAREDQDYDAYFAEDCGGHDCAIADCRHGNDGEIEAVEQGPVFDEMEVDCAYREDHRDEGKRGLFAGGEDHIF